MRTRTQQYIKINNEYLKHLICTDTKYIRTIQQMYRVSDDMIYNAIEALSKFNLSLILYHHVESLTTEPGDEITIEYIYSIINNMNSIYGDCFNYDIYSSVSGKLTELRKTIDNIDIMHAYISNLVSDIEYDSTNIKDVIIDLIVVLLELYFVEIIKNSENIESRIRFDYTAKEESIIAIIY